MQLSRGYCLKSNGRDCEGKNEFLSVLKKFGSIFS